MPVGVEVEDGGGVLSVAGQTIDVSALGFSAQVAPASIPEGEAVQARLTLPNGHEVEGMVDVVAGGSVIRARWTAVPERSRDRIVGVINQVQASRLRRDCPRTRDLWAPEHAMRASPPTDLVDQAPYGSVARRRR